MKIILTSDWHLRFDQPTARKDNFEEAVKEKIDYLFGYAYNTGAVILQAGDIFHKPRNWYVFSWFYRFMRDSGLKVYSVCGQHDMYLYSERNEATNYGVLLDAGYIEPLGLNREDIGEKIAVYGHNYSEKINLKIKNHHEEFFNILVIHAPILRKKIWEGQTGFMYAENFLKDHPEFDLILCGDMHYKFLYKDPEGRIICNTGPLLRAEASDYNMDHQPGFWVLDVEGKRINSMEWQDIPCAPASSVLSRQHIESKSKYSSIIEGLKDLSTQDNFFSFDDNLKLEVGNLEEDPKTLESVKLIISKLYEGVLR